MNVSELLQTPEGISALAICILAIAVLILAIVAGSSLGGLAKNMKKAVKHLSDAQDARVRQTTIDAVRRYETDPQLRDSIKHIYNKTVQGTDYTLLDPPDRFHVVTVLNYFDGIACGIEQGILVEPLVRDYLQFVLDKNVRALLKGDSGPTWAAGDPIVPFEGYETLLDLHGRWLSESNSTLYEMLR